MLRRVQVDTELAAEVEIEACDQDYPTIREIQAYQARDNRPRLDSPLSFKPSKVPKLTITFTIARVLTPGHYVFRIASCLVPRRTLAPANARLRPVVPTVPTRST